MAQDSAQVQKTVNTADVTAAAVDAVAAAMRKLQQEAAKKQHEKDGNFANVDVGVEKAGTKIVTPEGMTYEEAIACLQRKIKEEETVVAIHEEVIAHPLDGSYALMQVLREIFGWAHAAPTPGFFGPQPPVMVNLEVGYEKSVQVIWGGFTIPGVEGQLQTSWSQKNGQVIFAIAGKVKQKYKEYVKTIADRVRSYVRQKSVYKGQAIRIRADEDGELNFDFEYAPQFMDLSHVDERELIFSNDVRHQVQTSIFTPIEKTELCRKLNIPLKRGVLLEGRYGCIQGDAEICVNRAGKGFKIKLKDLVNRFNGNSSRYTWDLSIPTFVQCENDGVVRLNKLEKAWCSGIKPTYTITTETGRQVRATSEHPFKTLTGWKKLSELKVGDSILARGEQKGEGRTQKAQYEVRYTKEHPYRRKNNVVDVHRLVAEASLNNLSYQEYCLKLDGGKLGDLQFIDPSKYAVHHKNRDAFDNRIENLEVMTHREHQALHASDWTSNVLYKAVEEKISSIEFYGDEMTYDLSLESEPHNFLANGFVVHNTGKTLTANVTAKKCVENGWTFIYLDRVVALREAMLFARQYSPAVIFAEDIDRVVSGDRDVKVDDVLNNIDGVDSKNQELMVILTTNNVEAIDPAMLRPGRLDAIISVTPPDAAAAAQLIRIYARGLVKDSEDLTAPGKELDGQIPAVIREVVERAKLEAIFRLGLVDSENQFTLTAQDLVLAAKSMKHHLKLMAPPTAEDPSAEEKVGQALVVALAKVLNANGKLDFSKRVLEAFNDKYDLNVSAG